MRRSRWLQGGGFVTLFFLLFNVPVVQAEKNLAGIAADTLRNQQQVQKMSEVWSAEEKKLFAELELLSNQLDNLQVQSDQLSQVLLAEERRIAQQRHRLTETKGLRDGLQSWLQDVVQQYRTQTQLSLPFLAAEREKRLTDLETVVVDPFTPLYEKFRRVFEVFLVETEFGYSSEVYRDNIELAGVRLQVDLLRVGRTALFFRTPDGSRSGYYDPSVQQFRFFSESSPDLSGAFAMVRRESAAKMVSLPVGRILLP